jgi:hypothetical protein
MEMRQGEDVLRPDRAPRLTHEEVLIMSAPITPEPNETEPMTAVWLLLASITACFVVMAATLLVIASGSSAGGLM